MALALNFGQILSALQTNGVTGTSATNVLSSIASSITGSVSSQVQQLLTQLMTLTNNPQALAATGPQIVTKIEGISGLPATVLPLLEQLRTACTAAPENALQVAQLIASIESAVSAQTSVL